MSLSRHLRVWYAFVMQSQQQTGDKKILDEVRDVMRLHHYSIHTEQGGQGVPSPLVDLDVETKAR